MNFLVTTEILGNRARERTLRNQALCFDSECWSRGNISYSFAKMSPQDEGWMENGASKCINLSEVSPSQALFALLLFCVSWEASPFSHQT